MTLRTLLVDDEPLALEYLSALVSTHPCVVVADTCRNGMEAVTRLQRQDIDLVFMDIEMPEMTGLEVVARLQADSLPMIVFTTAYHRYALEAFDVNAVDYLLKPLEEEKVQRAVERVLERYAANRLLGNKGSVVSVIDQLNRVAPQDQDEPRGGLSMGKLVIKDGSETHLVDFADIDWIDAAGDYMCVHGAGSTFILRSTMKELVDKLPENFARIHRSTIVNFDRVTSVATLAKGESMLQLADATSLKVSRNYNDALKRFIGKSASS